MLGPPCLAESGTGVLGSLQDLATAQNSFWWWRKSKESSGTIFTKSGNWAISCSSTGCCIGDEGMFAVWEGLLVIGRRKRQFCSVKKARNFI